MCLREAALGLGQLPSGQDFIDALRHIPICHHLIPDSRSLLALLEHELLRFRAEAERGLAAEGEVVRRGRGGVALEIAGLGRSALQSAYPALLLGRFGVRCHVGEAQVPSLVAGLGSSVVVQLRVHFRFGRLDGRALGWGLAGSRVRKVRGQRRVGHARRRRCHCGGRVGGGGRGGERARHLVAFFQRREQRRLGREGVRGASGRRRVVGQRDSLGSGGRLVAQTRGAAAGHAQQRCWGWWWWW